MSLCCLHPCPSLLPASPHPWLHGAKSLASFTRQSSTAPCVFQGSAGLQAARSRQEAAESLRAATLHWEGASAELGLSLKLGLGEALQCWGDRGCSGGTQLMQRQR